MIGALARRVTLERPDRTEDAGGGAAVVWTPVAVVWARVRSRPGRDREVAHDLASHVEHEIDIRWRGDVRPGWRVVLDGRALRIWAVVDPAADKRWLELRCEEETG